MRHKIFAAGCMIALAGAVAGPATAQDTSGYQRIGLGVSVLGLTVEPSLRLSPTFGLRAPIGAGEFSRTQDVEGNDIDATLRLGGVALLGDFYPMRGGFRISGGVLASNFRISGSTTGEYDLEGTTYTGTFSANAEAKNKLNPMLVLGYDTGSGGAGWSVSGDLGVIYTNGLSGELNATTDNALLQAQLDLDLAETRTQFQSDISDVTILPYAKLAVAFRF